MSSYQQIPASRNPYPSIPYSQSFPNEPESSESSQLQAPLSNNNQQYHPPGHFNAQVAPMNQPGQLSGPNQGYNLPPQYMLVPIDPERKRLEAKVQDLDERIKSEWYFVYKVWLWIQSGFAALAGGNFLIVCLIVLFHRELLLFPSILYKLLVCFCIIHQCIVMKKAMDSKNLEGARRAFKLMIYFVLSLIVTFVGSVLAIYMKFGSLGQREIEFLATPLITLGLEMFFQLFGARQVIKLLEEREVIIKELDSRFAPAAVTNLA